MYQERNKRKYTDSSNIGELTYPKYPQVVHNRAEDTDQDVSVQQKIEVLKICSKRKKVSELMKWERRILWDESLQNVLPESSWKQRAINPMYRAASPTCAWKRFKCSTWLCIFWLRKLLELEYMNNVITKLMTYRWVGLHHGADCRQEKCKKNGSMMETYCERRNHENYICVKDHQKEGPEKVEHFCEKVPAVLGRNRKMIIYEGHQRKQQYSSSAYHG